MHDTVFWFGILCLVFPFWTGEYQIHKADPGGASMNCVPAVAAYLLVEPPKSRLTVRSILHQANFTLYRTLLHESFIQRHGHANWRDTTQSPVPVASLSYLLEDKGVSGFLCIPSENRSRLFAIGAPMSDAKLYFTTCKGLLWWVELVDHHVTVSMLQCGDRAALWSSFDYCGRFGDLPEAEALAFYASGPQSSGPETQFSGTADEYVRRRLMLSVNPLCSQHDWASAAIELPENSSHSHFRVAASPPICYLYGPVVKGEGSFELPHEVVQQSFELAFDTDTDSAARSHRLFWSPRSLVAAFRDAFIRGELHVKTNRERVLLAIAGISPTTKGCWRHVVMDRACVYIKDADFALEDPQGPPQDQHARSLRCAFNCAGACARWKVNSSLLDPRREECFSPLVFALRVQVQHTQRPMIGIAARHGA